MDINKLAVLTNALGGYDEVESALDVPADLIQKAVEGNILSSYENALLETGFNKLYLNDDQGLDLEELFGTRADKFGQATDAGTTAGALNQAMDFLDRSELQDEFRALVAEGLVDIEDVQQGYGLFANLTTVFAERVIEEIRKTDGEAAHKLFEAYAESADDFYNYQDSEFWEWFRETFYGEAE